MSHHRNAITYPPESPAMPFPAFITSVSVPFVRTQANRQRNLTFANRIRSSSRRARPHFIPHANLQQPGPPETPSNAESETPSDPVETTLIPEAEALDPSVSTTVPPTYNLAGTITFLGGLMFYQGDAWLLPGIPVLLLGIFLSLQTVRVRFIFGPTRLSVAKLTSDGPEIIRGWSYDQMTNWEVWWPAFPVLAYFKESESYNGRGSIHFFPILCNGRVLLDTLLAKTPHIDKRNYL